MTRAFATCENGFHLAGNWQKAREYSDQGLAITPRDIRLLFTRAMLEYEVGNLDKGEVYMRDILEIGQLTNPTPTMECMIPYLAIPMVTLITERSDRLEVADDFLRTVLSLPSVNPMVAIRARIALGLRAVLQGDAEGAREHYEILNRYEDITMPQSGIMCVGRLLGLMSQTMDHLDEAIVHFEKSITFSRRIGARPERAWSAYECSKTLLQRYKHDDRDKALSLVNESRDLALELGMRPLMEKATTLHENICRASWPL